MEFLSAYKNAFDQYLAHYSYGEEPTQLYEPVEYIMNLSGKRIRPLMVLLSAECFGAGMNDAMKAAMAVEIFHNFTLVHDDIMDEAPLRRGQATVHEKYDTNTGILSGDVMLIQSYNLIGDYPDAKAIKLLRVFNTMAVQVCEGQQMDVDFETESNVSIESYLKMIEYKTSVLIAAALQMGAIIGDADDQDAYHIYKYGVNVGIAFQMQDDILDTFGTEEVGKQVAGDIIQNKKTYLYLKALELSSPSEKEELELWYSVKPEDPTEKITRVKEIMGSAHVVNYANEVKLAYKDLALSHLESIRFGDEKKVIFRKIADFLLSRDV